MKTYKINEIFYSVQGEGFHAGTPMVFVRFSGCNLKCHFCDTQHQTYTEMTAVQIMEEVTRVLWESHISLESPCLPPICWTGGEPLLQLDRELMEEAASEFHQHVETNGTVDVPSGGELFDCITVSPKQPLNRKAIERMMEWLRGVGELKVVWDLSNETLLHGILREWDSLPFLHRFIQPMTFTNGEGEVVNNVDKVVEFIKHNPQWCLSYQMQRVWGVR